LMVMRMTKKNQKNLTMMKTRSVRRRTRRGIC
jgi:hypothetical protein